jgi:hypothetical protein
MSAHQIKFPAQTVTDVVVAIHNLVATVNTISMQRHHNDLNPHYTTATKSYEGIVKFTDDNELHIHTDLGLFASITEHDHSLNECLDLPVGYVIDDSYTTLSVIDIKLSIDPNIMDEIKQALKNNPVDVCCWYGETEESIKTRKEARFGHDNS